MGLKTIPEDSCSLADIAPDSFQKKPLFAWLRSFAGRELDEDDSFANFVSSNALTYALEYIGIASESEQSSLHLSAIFDEEHQSRSNKYPSHFESETKSRIQQLNRIFVELISYYDYHHGQIVAIKPPNTVHISSSCHLCGVREFEKFLFLIMGAAIQGAQKQETIKKIKRFPQEIQESLINCIKFIAADSPELISFKSWQQFHSIEEEDEQKKTYENLLAVIRRLLIERNESIQNQLLSDYYAGFMNCSQRRIYENKGYGSFSDTEKYSDDTRMSTAIRQLREELQVKSELLQECREELEITKYHVRELESELTETQIKLRAYKKARDELDVLREGQVKSTRLESELHRLKNKLEEAEHVYERVEVLEVENRKLQLQHDVLVDQISFLSLDRPSFDCINNSSSSNIGIVPSLSVDLDRTLTRDEDKFFESEEDEDEPSVKEKLVNNTPAVTEPVLTIMDELQEADNKSIPEQNLPEIKNVEDSASAIESNLEDQERKTDTENFATNNDTQDGQKDAEDKNSQCSNALGNDSDFSSQLLNENNGDDLESGPLTSTPVSANKQGVEQKSQEVQTPPFPLNSKRKKRSAMLSIKRTKKPIYIPMQRLVPVVQEDVLGENVNGIDQEGSGSPAIKVFKIYNVHRPAKRRTPGKSKKPKTPNGRQLPEKEVEPNNVDIGHEADEELSISPNGPRNESDLDSNNDVNIQTEKPTADNEEIFFSPDPCVTHPEVSPSTLTTSTPVSPPHTTPSLSENNSPGHYGTTTAFPVTNGVRHTHIVHHVTFKPNTEENGQGEHHSNHLTIYNHQHNNNNNIIKEVPEGVQLPLLRISNGINVSLQHSDTEEEDDEVTKRLRSAYNIHLQHQLQQQQGQDGNGSSPSGEGEASTSLPTHGQFNNNDNEFSFSDCNIQVNLRNSSVKPATAYVNKISTLTAANGGNTSSGGGGGGILRGHPPPSMNSTQSQYYQGYYQPQSQESSSEDDASVWYEYGCV